MAELKQPHGSFSAFIALAFIAFAGAGGKVHAAGAAATVKVGDNVPLQMTGELAKKYARRMGTTREANAVNGIQVETTVTIAQKLDDGRFRVEHMLTILRDGEKDRLLTLTGTVDSSNFTTDLVINPTVIKRPVVTFSKAPTGAVIARNLDINTAHLETRNIVRLKLSGLKGLELRTWSISDEVGN
jgi:hypothetical protein